MADFPVQVTEKRTPRFSNRLWQTPADIAELTKAVRHEMSKEKELFYDRFSEGWSQIMQTGTNKVETEKRLNIVYEKLFKNVQIKDKKFLEVGCGLGFFSKEAVKRGANVIGSDIGPNLVKICQKEIPQAKFVVASGVKLPFKTNSFDMVLSTEVIEHVEDQDKTLDQIYRVLKKGGYCVLTTPNKVFKPLFDILSILHLRPYHGNENWLYINELKNKLREKGFKIEKEIYFNFIYPVKFLDFFENFSYLKYLMINQGYLLKK